VIRAITGSSSREKVDWKRARSLSSRKTAFVISVERPASFEFESEPDQHVALTLTFNELNAPIVMSLRRRDAKPDEVMASDMSGKGRRMLSVFEPEVPMVFIVEISTTTTDVRCSLEIVRTPFADGDECERDCARLLQFPLPMDASWDGYSIPVGSRYRYQFGRRDVIMLTRHVAREMRKANYGPIRILDLSQWDGDTPGKDVGVPRHQSHKRGIDVDLSLFDNSGTARLRAYCDTKTAPMKINEGVGCEFVYSADKQPAAGSGGLVCRAGRVHDFNSYGVARMLGLFFSTGSVRLSFLDQELLLLTREACQSVLFDGLITQEIAELFSDGVHLQKLSNHFDHIHIRLKETRKFG
jgi:hypothetical protein